jgi:cell wall-associated NlpC family hydrolase
MGDETASTVRDGDTRGSGYDHATALPRRRRWLKSTTSAATAFALALPLVGLTDVVAPSTALAAPGDQCVSESILPATKSAREATVARAAAQYFPSEQVAMATAVAGAESTWNPTAVNKAAGGNYGLWQINSLHDKLLKARDWSDPQDNAWMAYQVWDAADGAKGNGKGSWKPWSVYNSGSYKAYLRDSKTVTDDPNASTCVEAPSSAPVSIATWNVLKSNAKGRIAEGVATLAGSADVFGLQEMGSSSDRATANRAAAKAGFTMSTDHTAVPLFYRTDKYTLVEQGKVRAFPGGEKVERRGGKGTERTTGKSITWLQLRDNATQETFYVVNTHLLVGAYNRNAKKSERRKALYKQQITALTNLVDSFQTTSSAVYVTGDFNVNYDTNATPIVMMADHGLTPNWQYLEGGATIGKKTRIDYVWANRAPSEQTIGEKFGSDHSSVVVTFPPSTGVSGTMTPVNGSAKQEIYSIRTISDANSGQAYLVPIPTGKVGKVLNKALDQVGDQWTYGGDGPDAWDCSGLTAAAWKAAGVSLPHQSEAQQSGVQNVPLGDAQPGDIFWREGYVAIYLGTVGDQRLTVGSAKSKGSVTIQTMDESDIKAVLRPIK